MDTRAFHLADSIDSPPSRSVETVMASRTEVISIGYEGTSIGDLASSLVARGTQVLIDVRLNAVSRRPGFSKRALQSALEEQGIIYVHLRSLGNPKENRDGFRRGDSGAVAAYESVVDACSEELDRIADDLRGSVTAIPCYEADDSTCHRRVVIDRLGQRIPELKRSKVTE